MRTRSVFFQFGVSVGVTILSFAFTRPVAADVLFGDQTLLLPLAPTPPLTVIATTTAPPVPIPLQPWEPLATTVSVPNPVFESVFLPTPVSSIVSSTSLVAPVLTEAPTGSLIQSSAFPTPQLTTVLKMSDGGYYHPGTGKMLPTRDEMQSYLATMGYVMAPEAVTPDLVPSIPGTDVNQEPALIGVFGRARTQLQELLEQHRKAKSVTQYATTDTDWREITLAIWDKQTDEIKLYPGKKKGAGLQLEDGSINLKVTVSNGLNSQFVSADSDRYQVVGILYSLYLTEQLSKKKVRYRIEEVVYVPLSDAFHSDEMVKYGQAWLEGSMKRVYEGFDRQQVRSRAFPDRMLTEVVDHDLLLSILAIEHMDEAGLTKNQDHTLDRFFVTLAVNGDQAYAFSRSPAGALGIAQFMPKTYTGLVKQRPGVGLIGDFEKGMRSVENSIRAQALYLDTLLSEMPLDARVAFFDQSPEEVREYVVAAYNGGAPRITTAISFWTTATRASTSDFEPQERIAKIQVLINERQAQLGKERLKSRVQEIQRDITQLKKQIASIQTAMKKKAKPALKSETVGYLKKYRILRDVITRNVI